MKDSPLYCPNCESKLNIEDKYCPKCGQKREALKITVKDFFQNILLEYFSFDSKFFKSLIPFIINPGYLILEFIKGKRVSYVSPFRLYFLISVVFFFVLSFYTGNKDSFEVSLNENDSLGISFGVNDTEIKYDKPQDLLDDIEKKGIENYLDSIQAKSFFERLVVKQTYSVVKNKGIGLQAIIFRNISFSMFFLMPLFALLLKLFFRKNNLYYSEHLIHSLYIHSFVFLIQTVFLLISFLIDAISTWHFLVLTFIIMSIYTYYSFKKVYQYKTWGTIWRMMVIIPLYNILILLCVLLVLLISLAVY